MNLSNEAVIGNIRRDVENMERYIRSTIAPGHRRSAALAKLEEFSIAAVEAVESDK